jgi:hypothetical protein
MEITPRNDAAFKKNTAAGPQKATTAPPNAGPTALAMLNETLLSATAAGSSSLDTRLGTTTCQQGIFIAAPSPSANVKPRRAQGVVIPQKVIALSPAAAANIHP